MASIFDYFQNHDEYKIVPKNGGHVIHAYNAEWPLMTPHELELTAYKLNWDGQALRHLKKAHHLYWPQFEEGWNYWTERRFSAHLEGHKIITWAAGANTGKSFDAAALAMLFWLGNPTGRTVLVASTSINDLESRIWGYIKRFYSIFSAVPLPGKYVSTPPPKILFDRMDTIHGMFAVPLQKGTSDRTASTLIGRHPDEAMLVIVDEGTDVSPGFMDAIPNWEKAPWFQCIVIGNSKSLFDPHGLLSRPVDGIDKVDPDKDKEWPTKHGLCLYFDCYQSPAIHEKDPLKKAALSKFLPTEESINEAAVKYGEKSAKFYRFTRGFWPLGEETMTVLNPLDIDKFKAQEACHWSGHGEIHLLGGLDPAFTEGGDECILRFARLGIASNGLWTLDYGGERNIHVIPIDSTGKELPEHQIVNQAMKICHEVGCKPENLAVDIWGSGTALGGVFAALWSNAIYKVPSAGPCSDTYVDDERKLLAKDVYDRRVTELWFSMQRFVKAGQIKGLDEKSCEQFCTREYSWKGKKYRVETKDDYKQRLGKVDNRYRSPDRADAAALVLDLARQFFAFIPGAGITDSVLNPSPLRRYFAQFYNSGIAPESAAFAERHHSETHPSAWDDSFTVSQFDVLENDEP